jgi:hypothetical protein
MYSVFVFELNVTEILLLRTCKVGSLYAKFLDKASIFFRQHEGQKFFMIEHIPYSRKYELFFNKFDFFII